MPASLTASAIGRRCATTCGLWLLLALAHAPLLQLQFRHIWGRPHYRFFPLLLAIVAGLVWQRRKRWQSAPYVRGRWLERSLLLVALFMLSSAILHGSPFLAAASAVLSTGFAIVHLGGLRAIPILFGPWMLLWFMVPPPLGTDLTLISELQGLTSRLSSRMLDLLAVDHLMSGNVLHIAERTFLIDEACSGVHSLFALLAAAAVSLVVTSRGVRRGAVLMIMTIVWALLLNLVRVLSIALAYVWYDIDLSEGWVHEGLGLVMFAAAVLLVLSTDQLLHFTGYWLKQIAHFALRRSRRRRVYYRPSRAMASDGGGLAGDTPGPGRPSRRLTLVAAATYGLLLAVELSGLTAGETRRFSASEFPELARASLPERLGDWTLVSYEPVERDFSSDFGKHSDRWVYAVSGLHVAVSVDRLFHAWHELSRCYEGQGWLLTERAVHFEGPRPGQIPRAVVRFERETGEQGWLVFALLDGVADPLLPPATVRSSRLMERLRSRQTIQLQTFTATEGPLTPADQQLVETLFEDVAHHLQSLIRAHAPEESDG